MSRILMCAAAGAFFISTQAVAQRQHQLRFSPASISKARSISFHQTWAAVKMKFYLFGIPLDRKALRALLGRKVQLARLVRLGRLGLPVLPVPLDRLVLRVPKGQSDRLVRRAHRDLSALLVRRGRWVLRVLRGLRGCLL